MPKIWIGEFIIPSFINKLLISPWLLRTLIQAYTLIRVEVQKDNDNKSINKFLNLSEHWQIPYAIENPSKKQIIVVIIVRIIEWTKDEI